MINIKAEKSYFVYLSAPPGYSFSEGVCNDNVTGHECPHTSASVFAYNYRKHRFLLRGSDSRRLQRSPPPTDAAGNGILEPTEDELELGVTEGRSIKCVAVDRSGMPDGRIDVGVFRKVRVCIVSYVNYSLVLIDCLCNPHVLTKVTIISLSSSKIRRRIIREDKGRFEIGFDSA